jgi:hypothetical protein
MYTFSDQTVAEFYGRKFYAILNEQKETVAYSERIFEIPEKVRFLGTDKCLIFEKAMIWGGVIWGGVIWGGEIWGGEIRGGEIRGGEIWGGVIRGGVIWGGEIWGGEIRGGVHEYGKLEISLLQIQGTKHFCYARFSEDEKTIELGIGCERHSIEWWLENYELTGKCESYEQEEISEYYEYIRLFATRYAPELLEEKA